MSESIEQVEGISKEVKDLVRSLVRVNPVERLSAQDALLHPWFTTCTKDVINLSSAKSNMSARNKLKGTPEYNFNEQTPIGKLPNDLLYNGLDDFSDLVQK